MATINADMSANIAANSMVLYERIMTSTMVRLLANLLINCAKDDAVGRAISCKTISHVRGLDQGERIAEIELTRTLIIPQAGTFIFCW
jgi:flagellin-like hook-associated protein FlgL